MSKTERFPVTVQTERKSYAPGELVPVGTKDGISAEEVAHLRANFGDWAGPDVNSGILAGVDVTELQAQLDAVTQERDDLQGEKDRLTAENGRLTGEIDKRAKPGKVEIDKLTTENARLTSKNAELTAAKMQLETDNAALAGHVDQLNGDLAKLTAPND